MAASSLSNSIFGSAPEAPDFHECKPSYGSDIVFGDCMSAFRQLTSGSTPITYIVNPTDQQRAQNPFVLPLTKTVSTCTITVEVSGPNQPSVWSIAPDDLRRMVGFILTQCVALRRTGGFITRDFEKMLLFLVDTPTLGGTTINPIVQTNRVYPTSSAFLTAKISGPNVPGRVDPSIFVAVSLWSYAAHRMGSTSGVTDLEHRLKTWLNLIIAKEFATKALAQSAADSTTTWAPSTLVPDEMTYDCDANLGAPSAANCSNINYSQLGAPSTKIMIGPGTPKVLSLDECNVVISAGTNIVITWDQIRLALEGLLLFCVSRPWQSSIGGRAYYNPEPQFAAPSSFKRAAAELSGLNALPPHVNVTISQSGYSSP